MYIYSIYIYICVHMYISPVLVLVLTSVWLAQLQDDHDDACTIIIIIYINVVDREFEYIYIYIYIFIANLEEMLVLRAKWPGSNLWHIVKKCICQPTAVSRHRPAASRGRFGRFTSFANRTWPFN